MKIAVTYTSKTGFTKQYAEWIAQDLGCEAISAEKFKDASDYDLVIHGGWIMGGMISGLENMKKLQPAKLVTFGVGFTREDNYVDTIKETNHTQDMPAYYFVGGMNPEKLNFFSKLIVKMVTKNTPKYEDYTDRNSISALVEYVKSLEG